MTEKNKKGLLSVLKIPSSYDRLLLLVTYALIIFSTIMLMSISIRDASSDSLAIYRVFLKQFVFIAFGTFALFICAKLFTCELAKSLALPAMIVCIILLIACLYFDGEYGIHAWIRFEIFGIVFTIQPSEFVKITSIILFATSWGTVSNKFKVSPNEVIYLPLALFLVSAFIILKFQDDFGSCSIAIFIVAIISLIPVNKVFETIQRSIKALAAFGIFMVGLICFSPLGLTLLSKVLGEDNYMYIRFAMARNPFVDVLNNGMQYVHSLLAFYEGGLTGVGLGNSIYKYTIPSATADSILPVICEELGFMGFMFIFICYVIIIYKFMYYAIRINNICAKMIMLGFGTYFFVHFLLNVGGISVLIPLTGIPLLFVSYGGSSLLSGMVAIGIGEAIISAYNKGKLREPFSFN